MTEKANSNFKCSARNSGWGCQIMDCVRHLPNTHVLSDVHTAICPRVPHSAQRKLELIWLNIEHVEHSSDEFSNNWPVTHMDWELGTSSPLCRFSASTGKMLTSKTCIATAPHVNLSEAYLRWPKLSLDYEILTFRSTWSSHGLRYITDMPPILLRTLSHNPLVRQVFAPGSI